MSKNYYKAVKVLPNGRLVSFMLDETNPLFRVYRENGECIKVKDGMAFTTSRAAIGFLTKFKDYYNQYEVWECAGKETPMPKRCFVATTLLSKNVLDWVLYGKKFSGAIKPEKVSWPKYSVRLKNLTLTKKVW